jgi:hypothetical protein
MTRAERALQIWQVLIGAAHNRQTLTYTMLADLIGLPERAQGPSLTLIMNYCKQNELPPLTVLVVHKHTGQPGIGLITLEDLNLDREHVFNYPWFGLRPLQVSDLALDK